MKLNKKYKDRLFCLLFGNEEYKENILSLYNALCNTAHTDVNDIKLYTIDSVIYIEMKNDVSILLDSYLHLWEQQSSYNPNMPLRGLMYFSKMYDRYICRAFLQYLWFDAGKASNTEIYGVVQWYIKAAGIYEA